MFLRFQCCQPSNHFPYRGQSGPSKVIWSHHSSAVGASQGWLLKVACLIHTWPLMLSLVFSLQVSHSTFTLHADNIKVLWLFSDTLYSSHLRNRLVHVCSCSSFKDSFGFQFLWEPLLTSPIILYISISQNLLQFIIIIYLTICIHL